MEGEPARHPKPRRLKSN